MQSIPGAVDRKTIPATGTVVVEDSRSNSAPYCDAQPTNQRQAPPLVSDARLADSNIVSPRYGRSLLSLI